MTISQRCLLTLLAGCLPLHGTAFSAERETEINAESAVAYINSCRKPNGAFGPADQDYTDAAWNQNHRQSRGYEEGP